MCVVNLVAIYLVPRVISGRRKTENVNTNWSKSTCEETFPKRGSSSEKTSKIDMLQEKLKMKELGNKHLIQSLVVRTTRTLSCHKSDRTIDNAEREFSHRRPNSNNVTHGKIENNHNYYGPLKNFNLQMSIMCI